MARTVLEVFLSSTAPDLAAYRQAASARLARIEFLRCVRQEDFGAQDARAVAFCREKVGAADLFVGLVGLRRGWEPDGDGDKRSITEMEHDFARAAGRRRYLWVTPDDFLVRGDLRESAAAQRRQLTFRKRVMAGGERIVSQKGFDSPDLLASEIVEQLLTHVVTSDLIALLRPDLQRKGVGSVEEEAPAVAAAVERLAADKDIDLLEVANNPQDIDVAEFEAKMRERVEQQEAAGRSKIEQGRRDLRASAEYWRHIGTFAFLQDTRRALAAYAKAVELDPDEPEGWRFFGELQYRLGDTAAAERAFETLTRLGRQTSDPRAEAMGYLRLGWIYLQNGNPEAAQEKTGNALRLAQADGWSEGMARAYGNLGVLHQTRGELAEAEEMHVRSLRLNEELGRKDGMAICYGNLGAACRARGDLARAAEMQLKSLKLNEELGSKEGMARAYANLGNIHRDRGQLTQAKEMQLKSLKLAEELGSKEGMARACANLGTIHSVCGDLAQAEEMQLRSLNLKEDLGRKADTAAANWDLGNTYQRMGNKARMCDCLRKARDLWRDVGLTQKAAEAESKLKSEGCDVLEARQS